MGILKLMSYQGGVSWTAKLKYPEKPGLSQVTKKWMPMVNVIEKSHRRAPKLVPLLVQFVALTMPLALTMRARQPSKPRSRRSQQEQGRSGGAVVSHNRPRFFK